MASKWAITVGLGDTNKQHGHHCSTKKLLVLPNIKQLWESLHYEISRLLSGRMSLTVIIFIFHMEMIPTLKQSSPSDPSRSSRYSGMSSSKTTLLSFVHWSILFSLLNSKSNDGMNCKVQKVQVQRNKKDFLYLNHSLSAFVNFKFDNSAGGILEISLHFLLHVWSTYQFVKHNNTIYPYPPTLYQQYTKYNTPDTERQSKQTDTSRNESSWKCLAKIQTSCSGTRLLSFLHAEDLKELQDLPCHSALWWQEKIDIPAVVM